LNFLRPGFNFPFLFDFLFGSGQGRPTCGPRSETIFLCGPNCIQSSKNYRHFDNFPISFRQIAAQIMEKVRPRDQLWIGRLWFRLRALKSSILKAGFVGCQLRLMKNYCELGDGVSSGPGLIQLISKNQQKVDDLLSQEQ
jgi:hypothetical protein